MRPKNEEGLIKAGEARNRLLEADNNLSYWRFVRPLGNMVKDSVVFSVLVWLMDCRVPSGPPQAQF